MIMHDLQLPTQQQLLFPLLQVLEKNGPMRACDAAEAVADRLEISSAARSLRVAMKGGQEVNVFQRKVRWVRQNAKLGGLLLDRERGIWELAEPAANGLTMARPGVVVNVARDEFGSVLWAEAISAMGYLDDGVLSAIITSAPYPLNRQREYGGWGSDSYLETILAHVDAMKPKLAATGSMVLNFGDCYMKGLPVLNTYQEELVVELKRRGWFLCGKHQWANPGKPKTTPYVTKDRTRVAAGVESFWWWAKTPHPASDNRRVLLPYSEKHKATIAAGGEYRLGAATGARQSSPGLRYRADNGGKIPFNYTVCAHEGSGSAYMRHCKAQGLPFHPARMPMPLAEFFVKLTTAPGEIVFDPFGGSLTTAAACQKLGRQFITSEKCLEYIRGGVFRLGAGVEGLAGLTAPSLLPTT